MHKPVLALTLRRAGGYIGCVKWRNQLLALFCLFVFFAFGVIYFRYWVIQKPFGIILFIGEGLDAQILAAARIQASGPDKALQIDALDYAALLKNYSANSTRPDPAAAATALATGVKVPNGHIGQDAEGHALANIIELAHESGRLTGLVTNGSLTAPTSASFYAHATVLVKRGDRARQLIESNNIDLVLGGGSADFTPSAQDGGSADDRDLLALARENGYELVKTLSELEEVPRWRRPKLVGLFAEQELPFADAGRSEADEPSLSDMVRRAIELLQFHRGGYLLVVDVALMRKAARQHSRERQLAEALELDRALSVAVQYVGPTTAVFVCGDVVTPDDNPGNLNATQPATAALSPADPGSQNGSVSEETRPSPAISIAVNPTAEALLSPEQFPSIPAAPIPSPSPNLPEDVLSFGTGLGADALHGVLDNTAVFEIIRDNL